MREPNKFRAHCGRNLEVVEVCGMFKAELACPLDEVWTAPQIEELRLSPDGGFFARLEG